ncbi:hypothetical protein [Streptomyces mirabilis]|uniref:DUF4240 domain-containing protein n=1 Tax=Streptomyces mirabilis TaxID=68239 RepID=A0ABU3V4Z0_9ACTN|nr:hypothetical protein [Streptomyces mirabilis]MCX5355585.1 hypothetical protein [Streptomyces mirabilis]MDU9001231.1 hypothetical protein [Streptomyces mirabilis]
MGTTQLTRLRTRMLATAYSNADIWTQRTAFLTDQAVVALARRDPAAAEALAALLLTPEILHDTQILGAAVEAGIDTSAWEERREKTRTYAREAYELPPQFDPATEAKRIWASLYDHYPQIAADLAVFLRDLPPTWHEDLFTSSPHSPAATRRTVLELPGPETAPYDPLDWEDCPACAEAQDQCRYHRGVFDGMEYQRALIKTALTDHLAIDQLQQRHTARTAAADTSTSS